jgi:hypothetical protein
MKKVIDTSEIDLTSISEFLDDFRFFEDCITARLLDEEDENGPVVLCDSVDNVRCIMPQSVYRELMDFDIKYD